MSFRKIFHHKNEEGTIEVGIEDEFKAEPQPCLTIEILGTPENGEEEEGFISLRSQPALELGREILRAFKYQGDSPVLLAEPAGESQWRVWCPFCKHYHYHGVGEGHREAHCHDNGASPLRETGYVIMLPPRRPLSSDDCPIDSPEEPDCDSCVRTYPECKNSTVDDYDISEGDDE